MYPDNLDGDFLPDIGGITLEYTRFDDTGVRAPAYKREYLITTFIYLLTEDDVVVAILVDAVVQSSRNKSGSCGLLFPQSVNRFR